MVGNDPTGRNPRRVAGDGDPARASGAVLEQERERDVGRETSEWVWGVGTPLPESYPTCSLDGAVVPCLIAVVPLGGSTAPER